MNRRVWTGVVAGVLAAALLLSVGVGSFRAGQDDRIVTRSVENGVAAPTFRKTAFFHG